MKKYIHICLCSQKIENLYYFKIDLGKQKKESFALEDELDRALEDVTIPTNKSIPVMVCSRNIKEQGKTRVTGKYS